MFLLYKIKISQAKLRIDFQFFFSPVFFVYSVSYFDENKFREIKFIEKFAYAVMELKIGDFKPEYATQLNFYLSAVDGSLKKDTDNPSIGLLLCKSKNNLVAEYSLRDMSKPIGVSEYKITNNLPKELEKQLPSAEDIQKKNQRIILIKPIDYF